MQNLGKRLTRSELSENYCHILCKAQADLARLRRLGTACTSLELKHMEAGELQPAVSGQMIASCKVTCIARPHRRPTHRHFLRTSNDSRVAGVILGDVLLDLADQVSAHVGSLGVDAAAHASKQGNGGASEAVPSNSLKDTLPVVAIHLKDVKMSRADSV